MLSVKEWKAQNDIRLERIEIAIHKEIDEQLTRWRNASMYIMIDRLDWNRYLEAGGAFKRISAAYRAGGWDVQLCDASSAAFDNNNVTKSYVTMAFFIAKDL